MEKRQCHPDKKRWIWARAQVPCLQSGCSAASTEPTLMRGHGCPLWSTALPFTLRPLVTTSARGLLHKASVHLSFLVLLGSGFWLILLPSSPGATHPPNGSIHGSLSLPCGIPLRAWLRSHSSFLLRPFRVPPPQSRKCKPTLFIRA